MESCIGDDVMQRLSKFTRENAQAYISATAFFASIQEGICMRCTRQAIAIELAKASVGYWCEMQDMSDEVKVAMQQRIDAEAIRMQELITPIPLR